MKIDLGIDVEESDAKSIVEDIRAKHEIDGFVMAQLGLTLGYLRGGIGSVEETKLLVFALLDVLEGMQAVATSDGEKVFAHGKSEPKAD